MGLFHWFPKVNRFCWCTRNLKWASFIIIFLGMVTSITTAGVLCTPTCKELYNVSSPVKTVTIVFRWILFTCELLLLSSAFAFLLGIVWSLPITADILICSVILKCIISIIYSILIVIQEQYTHCHWYHSQTFNLILFIIMWSYFILVLNTFSEEM